MKKNMIFVLLGIKLTYGMNPENLRISENSRISRETDDLGSDDEDYSRSSGDYDDIINDDEDYSDSEYELPVSENLQSVDPWLTVKLCQINPTVIMVNSQIA